MGVKHFFKKLAGKTPEQKEAKRKKQAANAFLEGAMDIIAQRQQEEEAQMEETSEPEIEVSEPQLKISSNDGGYNGDELSKLRTVLARSAKGGGGNDSAKYQAVDIMLLKIQDLMERHFGAKDAGEDVQMLVEMMNYYSELMDACDEYLDRKAHTKAGKDRQSIVSTIRNIADRDSKGMGKAMDELPTAGQSERSKMTWRELFKTSRTDQYTIPKMTAATGGQASEVFMFDNPDKSSDTKKLFFKPETKFDLDENMGVWVLGKYRETHPDEVIDEKTVGALKRATSSGSTLGYASKEDEALAKTLKDQQSLSSIISSINVQVNDVFGSMDTKSGKQDITGRNVATSRVADLLGLGHIVARSTFAEVDDGKGNKRKGIVMEGVGGIEAKKWTKNFGMRAYGHQKGDEEFADEKYAFHQFDGFHGENDIFQPSFFRDITSLQVLDCICGQADRHFGNFFLQPDEKGRFVSVKGIDNDSAFGNNVTPAHRNNMQRHDKNVFSDDGQLEIPYIDKKLSERIMSLTPGALRMVLADILETEAIDAAVERLKRVKEAISNAKEGQILDSDRDWGTPQVKNEMLRVSSPDKYDAYKNDLVSKGLSSPEANKRTIGHGTYMAEMDVYHHTNQSKYNAYVKERSQRSLL